MVAFTLDTSPAPSGGAGEAGGARGQTLCGRSMPRSTVFGWGEPPTGESGVCAPRGLEFRVVWSRAGFWVWGFRLTMEAAESVVTCSLPVLTCSYLSLFLPVHYGLDGLWVWCSSSCTSIACASLSLEARIDITLNFVIFVFPSSCQPEAALRGGALWTRSLSAR